MNSKGNAAVTDKVVVLVTCATVDEARRIARAAVEARLAACANIVQSRVDSIYRWKAKIERAREFLLLMKSSRKKLGALNALVVRMHSYDVPEFIALPIASGSKAYLAWLDECLAQPRGEKRSAGRSGS